MDALLPALIGALLADIGDKTQMTMVALIQRYRRALPIAAGAAVAVIGHSLFSAFAGVWIGRMITYDAATLMLGIALMLAASGMIFMRKPKPLRFPGLGAFPASLLNFALAQFGDKTQFLTFVIAARTGEAGLAAAGAALGSFATAMLALGLGADLARTLPLRLMRYAIGTVFLIAGFWFAVSALRLV